jgi:sigma-B regulation protein RsbU (phosphoserine phosphatase)
MADVSGKGIPAALIMVMIRSILKNTINSNANASQLMTILNNTLMGEIPEDRYVTTFLFIVDTKNKTIDYCNGGHHPMILFRKINDKAEVYLLDSEGVPVGVIPNFNYPNKKTTIKGNDLFITYTDGITEAMNKDREEFGKQRLMRIINKYSHLESKKLSQIINRAIAKFSEGKQHDDETLLIFKLRD